MKIFLLAVILVPFFPKECFGWALHYLRRPITLHPSYNERKPVLTGLLYGQRKPVSLNHNHDQRQPVLVNPDHDRRKPIVPDGSYDLRWPVLEEDSHDSRMPVLNWFHLAMSHLFQSKPTTTTEIHQETTGHPDLENGNLLTNSTTGHTDLPISTISTTSSENLSEDILRHLKWERFHHRCGAVLLGRLWVITAAHCVFRKRTSELQLGFSDFNRSVKEVVIHPDYNHWSYEIDLALLRLHEPLLLDSDVTPVCLPPPQLPDITGRWAVVTGFGQLSEKGELPTSLHEVILPIISNAECEEMYAKAGHKETISDNFLCAGNSSGGRDTCDGDSGGPMVVRGGGGQWVLVGITSWGMGCAAPLKPGVYTRISQFTDWINGIVTY